MALRVGLANGPVTGDKVYFPRNMRMCLLALALMPSPALLQMIILSPAPKCPCKLGTVVSLPSFAVGFSWSRNEGSVFS